MADYGVPVLTATSNFVEGGEVFLRTRGETTRILLRQTAIAEYAAQQIAVPILKEWTPVDTGALQASTEASIGRGDQAISDIAGVGTGLGAIVEQVVIEISQPAQNASGDYYAPYVILGHHTVSGSWVAPNVGPLGTEGGPGYPIQAGPAIRDAWAPVLLTIQRGFEAELVQFIDAQTATGVLRRVA